MKNDYLRLIIIGDGPILKECLKYCEKGLKYELKSKNLTIILIYISGHLENPISIIQKCRLFVMPSFMRVYQINF